MLNYKSFVTVIAMYLLRSAGIAKTEAYLLPVNLD
jgi:hypothetical protein